MSQLGGPGGVSVRGARYEVSGVVEAKLVEQLVDKTNEVLVDGKNGCAEGNSMAMVEKSCPLKGCVDKS